MKSFNKIISVLVVVCMMASLVPFTVFASGTSVSTYAELVSAVASASSGDVITLSADVTATSTITVAGNITITGGKAIIRSSSFTDRIFNVTGALTLENVEINSNRTTTTDLTKEVAYVAAGAALNLKSATSIHAARADMSTSCGGIWVDGTLNMYEGSMLYDLHTHNNSSRTDIIGTAVHVSSTGTFNMFGGSISYCDGKVGAVSNAGVFNMSGGEISGCISNLSGVGGTVYNSGTFNMTGGTVTGNTAWLKGGGVYNAGTFTLNGGSITNNATSYTDSTTCDGAGVVTSGTFYMISGDISGNTAQSCAGGVLVSGGEFKMTGGSISGNSTASYSGGGVFVASGKFTMEGGSITENTAAQFGGGIAVTGANAISITGGMVYSNVCSANHCGTDIYVTTAGNVAMTSFGSGCVLYNLYLDNKDSRYSESNAQLASSSTLTAGNGYVYVSNGAAHSFGDWVITEEAGCESSGLKTRTCSVCGTVEEEAVPPKGHNTVSESVAPTCTEDGYVKLYCPVCGYIHNMSTVPATGHTAGNWKVITTATLESDGTKARCCKTCGAFLEETSYSINDSRIYLTLSEPESVDEDTNTITLSVNIANNSGIWGAGFYVYYDEAFTAVGASNGTVFPADYYAEPSLNIDIASDSVSKQIFEDCGVSADGISAVCFYTENSEFADVTENGVIFTVTFEYSSAYESDTLFGFAFDPDNIITSEGDNADIIFENLTATVEPLIKCEHVAGAWVVIPATCTDNGIRTLSCVKCGKLMQSEVLSATGHTAGDWEITVEPGYTEGERVKKCVTCGIVLETEVLRPIYTSNIIVNDAVAVSGEQASVQVTIENNPGIYGIRMFIYYPQVLSVASVTPGSVFAQSAFEASPLNVDPASDYSASPVFERNGIATDGILTTCVCFENEDVADINAEGLLVTLTFNAPVEVGEYPVYILCDDVINSNVEDVEFTYYNGTITVCECEHANVTSETVPATCTVPGKTTYTCNDCGAVVRTETIPATGHVVSETWVTVTEPTCTESGIKAQKCTVCGETVNTDTVPATGHTLGEWTVTEEATCVKAGSKEQKCTVCGVIVNTETVPATGHIASDTWVTLLEPSCINTGLKVQRCTVCDEIVYTETIPANGHTFSEEFTVDIEATTEQEGSMSRHCLYCDEVTDVTVIPIIQTKLIGDVDGDGEITAKDSRLMKKHIFGLVGDDEIYYDNADTDGDGVISTKDFRNLTKLLLDM